MGNAIIERVSRLVPSRPISSHPVPSHLVSSGLVSVAGFAYKTRMRTSPVITVEVTSYWLTLRSPGFTSRPTVHRLDWLPPNGATYQRKSTRERGGWACADQCKSRGHYELRRKNVMRYYAATAVPFNEARWENPGERETRIIGLSPKPIRRILYTRTYVYQRCTEHCLRPRSVCSKLDGRRRTRSFVKVVKLTKERSLWKFSFKSLSLLFTRTSCIRYYRASLNDSFNRLRLCLQNEPLPSCKHHVYRRIITRTSVSFDEKYFQRIAIFSPSRDQCRNIFKAVV